MRTGRFSGFQRSRVIMEEIRCDNLALYQYIQNSSTQRVLQSESNVPCFGMLGTQAVESFNSVTKPWRGLPRLHFFKKVEQYVQSLFEKRRVQIQKAISKYAQPKACVPSIVEGLLVS